MLKSFQELATDNTSGATELIHRLLGVCESCLMGGAADELQAGVQSLFSAQLGLPSFHAVLHTLARDLFPLLAGGGDATAALAYIASLQQVLDESVTRISGHFLTLLKRPRRILTMSRSSTVIESVIDAHEHRKIRHAYVLESRPTMEGVKTIRDFDDRGIPCTLLVDAAMAEGMQSADFAVVGADGISADGFLLNKTGTHALALVCQAQEKPLYVLCDTLKFSPQLRQDIILESHPPEEVVERAAEDRFNVLNRYFEWTPMDRVTGFITEKGIYPPDQITRLFSP